MKLQNAMTLDRIKLEARKADRLVYAARTCWWKVGDPIYRLPDTQLPCDPRGSVLFETDKPLDFIEAAEKNQNHYGKHGLEAFVAAYHGNVTTDAGRPTSFDSWDEYNTLIDAKITTHNPGGGPMGIKDHYTLEQVKMAFWDVMRQERSDVIMIHPGQLERLLDEIEAKLKEGSE